MRYGSSENGVNAFSFRISVEKRIFIACFKRGANCAWFENVHHCHLCREAESPHFLVAAVVRAAETVPHAGQCVLPSLERQQRAGNYILYW